MNTWQHNLILIIVDAIKLPYKQKFWAALNNDNEARESLKESNKTDLTIVAVLLD